MSIKKPRTKTAGRIKNINAYINKVGAFFGKDSPEYTSITNKIAGFETYQNKKGYVNISNSKANRLKHQTIRAIDKNKPSFARQKKRYYEEQKRLFPTPVIPDLSEINDVTIPDIINSTGGSSGSGGPGGTNEPKDFDTWYKDWRNTWVEEEQYEVAKLAAEYGIEFDYIQWYHDYAYRDMIVEQLYEEYVRGINDELEQPDNSYAYDSDDLREGFNPDFGW